MKTTINTIFVILASFTGMTIGGLTNSLRWQLAAINVGILAISMAIIDNLDKQRNNKGN